jgi:tetratricopeptide (TPR) repeat protein
MNSGYLLRLSTVDGGLVVTLLAPDGARLALAPVELDPEALDKLPGPAEYGAALAAALLREPVAGELRQAGVIRLRLAVDGQARRLHALRWECLARGLRGPLSRLLHPDARDRARPPQTDWPLRILVAISNPADLEAFQLAPLDVDLEWAELQRALRPLQGLVELDLVEPPVTLDRIHQALEAEPKIFHYLGHGAYHRESGMAALFLESEAGRAVDTVKDEDLIERLGALPRPPHLMVLAACESAAQVNEGALVGLAPALVEAGAGAVVAMRDKVGIEVAREFVYHFYRRLATHGEIDLAAGEARKFLYDRGGWSWSIPALFMEWGAERIFATPPAMLEAPPARPGETLILIPEFQGHEPAFFEIDLRDRLQQQVAGAGLQNVRVVWLKKTAFGPGDDDEVRRLAARYGAALVLWGWYDRSRFRACFSVTESLFAYRDPTIFRSGGSVGSLFQAENDFEVYVNRDLPRQIDYFVFFTLGQLYYWEGNYEAALAALDQAIAAAETEAPADRPQGLAHAYFYRGNIYSIHRQDRPAAIANYRQALALDAALAVAAFNLGGSLRIWANGFRARGEEDAARQIYLEAITAYGQAIEIEPGYVPAYEGRALARCEIGQFEAAVEDYWAALAREPRAETYFQLGLALRSLQRWDGSLAALDLAIARAPGMGRYYFGRGRVRNALGDQDAAINDFQAYLRLAPASEASTRQRVAAWLAERGIRNTEGNEEVNDG